MITKDLCTYTMKILRQDKRLRDHGPMPTHSGKNQPVEDVEYTPQRGLGNATLARAIIAVVVTGILVSLSIQSRAAAVVAAFPAALAIAWFTSYASQHDFAPG
jgi:uncharacterized membrane protein YphA (DoxX/SURF4 family)